MKLIDIQSNTLEIKPGRNQYKLVSNKSNKLYNSVFDLAFSFGK